MKQLAQVMWSRSRSIVFEHGPAFEGKAGPELERLCRNGEPGEGTCAPERCPPAEWQGLRGPEAEGLPPSLC